MLTEAQEKYLLTIPDDILVRIKDFDSMIYDISSKLIKKIKDTTGLGVGFWGASALGIAGQNDIDLNILSEPAEYYIYLPKLKELFGEPKKEIPSLVKWEFNQDGFDVELYLTNKNSLQLAEQRRVYEILKSNQELYSDYEKLKRESDGISFRDYMRRKYEFFNKILSL